MNVYSASAMAAEIENQPRQSPGLSLKEYLEGLALREVEDAESELTWGEPTGSTIGYLARSRRFDSALADAELFGIPKEAIQLTHDKVVPRSNPQT